MHVVEKHHIDCNEAPRLDVGQPGLGCPRVQAADCQSARRLSTCPTTLGVSLPRMQVVEKHRISRDEAIGRLYSAVCPALLLVICVCFFWKLLLTNQYTWLDSPDTANQVLPWLQFQAGEWHQGRFPL